MTRTSATGISDGPGEQVRSGFDGPWSHNPLRFDNSYYKARPPPPHKHGHTATRLHGYAVQRIRCGRLVEWGDACYAGYVGGVGQVLVACRSACCKARRTRRLAGRGAHDVLPSGDKPAPWWDSSCLGADNLLSGISRQPSIWHQ
jgi:hypothetical protein